MTSRLALPDESRQPPGSIAQPTADRRARHPPNQALLNLTDTYRRLSGTETRDELPARYHAASRRGTQLVDETAADHDRPIPTLAGAVPPTATLSVSIHLLHALPPSAHPDPAPQLLDTAEQNAAQALYRCQLALELDARAHDYTTEEWLPLVCDTAELLLSSASLDQEPPTVVALSQEAISYLARALIELDQESPETACALADTLARLLALWEFAAVAREELSRSTS